MSAPESKFVEGSPRLHYLEWNPEARETLVLLHGNTRQRVVVATDGRRDRSLRGFGC